MKVKVTHGVSTQFEIEVPDDATVETVLDNDAVVTVCGKHNGARVNHAEMPASAPLSEGDEVEPFTKANDKG